MKVWKSITQVTSGDDKPRIRLVWGGRKWDRFLDLNQLRETIEELLDAYRILKERTDAATKSKPNP